MIFFLFFNLLTQLARRLLPAFSLTILITSPACWQGWQGWQVTYYCPVTVIINHAEPVLITVAD